MTAHLQRTPANPSPREGAGGPEVLSFRRRAPDFSRALSVLAMVWVAGVLQFAFLHWDHGRRAAWLDSLAWALKEQSWLHAVALAGVLATLAFRVTGWRHGARSVDVDVRGVTLPRLPLLAWRSVVPFADVCGVRLSGAGTRSRLIVSARHRLLCILTAQSMVDPDDLGRLEAVLLRGIAASDGGEERLAAIHASRRNWERVRQTRPWLTLTLLALLGLAYSAQEVTGWAYGSLAGMLGGQRSVWTVSERGLDLILTPSFLHNDVYHLAMNGVGILAIGWLSEAWLGRARTVVLLFVAGLAGAVATILWVPGVSLGASGMVYGLAGLALWLNVARRAELPLGVRWVPAVWIGLGAIELAAAFALPHMNWTSHMAALAAGTGVSALAVGARPLGEAHRPAGRIWTGAAVLGAVLGALSLVATARTVGPAGEALRVARFERVMNAPGLTDENRGWWAAKVLGTPDVDARYLEVNVATARRVLDGSPGDPRWEEILRRSERRLSSVGEPPAERGPPLRP